MLTWWSASYLGASEVCSLVGSQEGLMGSIVQFVHDPLAWKLVLLDIKSHFLSPGCRFHLFHGHAFFEGVHRVLFCSLFSFFFPLSNNFVRDLALVLFCCLFLWEISSELLEWQRGSKKFSWLHRVPSFVFAKCPKLPCLVFWALLLLFLCPALNGIFFSPFLLSLSCSIFIFPAFSPSCGTPSALLTTGFLHLPL